MPQRRAAARKTSRQQQRATRGLAEARGEERRLRQPCHDKVLRPVRVREHDLSGRRRGGLGEARDDPVVRPEHVDLDVAPLADHGADRHRPGRVHLAAEGREHADAPVADLVDIALDDDRPVVRHRARCRVLIGEVLEQVARGALVEVVLLDQPARALGRIGCAQ